MALESQKGALVLFEPASSPEISRLFQSLVHAAGESGRARIETARNATCLNLCKEVLKEEECKIHVDFRWNAPCSDDPRSIDMDSPEDARGFVAPMESGRGGIPEDESTEDFQRRVREVLWEPKDSLRIACVPKDVLVFCSREMELAMDESVFIYIDFQDCANSFYTSTAEPILSLLSDGDLSFGRSSITMLPLTAKTEAEAVDLLDSKGLASQRENIPPADFINPYLILLSPSVLSSEEMLRAVMTRIEGFARRHEVTVQSSMSLDCPRLADSISKQLSVKFTVNLLWNPSITGTLATETDLNQAETYDRVMPSRQISDSESEDEFRLRILDAVSCREQRGRVVCAAGRVIGEAISGLMKRETRKNELIFAYINLDDPKLLATAENIEEIEQIDLLGERNPSEEEVKEQRKVHRKDSELGEEPAENSSWDRDERREEEKTSTEEQKAQEFAFSPPLAPEELSPSPLKDIREVVSEIVTPASNVSQFSKSQSQESSEYSAPGQVASPTVALFGQDEISAPPGQTVTPPPAPIHTEVPSSDQAEEAPMSPVFPPMCKMQDRSHEDGHTETEPTAPADPPLRADQSHTDIGGSSSASSKSSLPPLLPLPECPPVQSYVSQPLKMDFVSRPPPTGPSGLPLVGFFSLPPFMPPAWKASGKPTTEMVGVPPSVPAPVDTKTVEEATATCSEVVQPPPEPLPKAIEPSSQAEEAAAPKLEPCLEAITSIRPALNAELNSKLANTLADAIDLLQVSKRKGNSKSGLQQIDDSLCELDTRLRKLIALLQEKTTDTKGIQAEQQAEVRKMLEASAEANQKYMATSAKMLATTQEFVTSFQNLRKKLVEKAKEYEEIAETLAEISIPVAKLPAVSIKEMRVNEGGELVISVTYRKHYPKTVCWNSYSNYKPLYAHKAELSKENQEINIGHNSYYPGMFVVWLCWETGKELAQCSFLNPIYAPEFAQTIFAQCLDEPGKFEADMTEEGKQMLHKLAIAWQNQSPEYVQQFAEEIKLNCSAGEQLVLQRLRDKGYIFTDPESALLQP